MHFDSDTVLIKVYTAAAEISTVLSAEYKHFVNYFCAVDGFQTNKTVLLD